MKAERYAPLARGRHGVSVKNVLCFSMSVLVCVFPIILIILLPLSSSGLENQEICVRVGYEVMSAIYIYLYIWALSPSSSGICLQSMRLCGQISCLSLFCCLIVVRFLAIYSVQK